MMLTKHFEKFYEKSLQMSNFDRYFNRLRFCNLCLFAESSAGFFGGSPSTESDEGQEEKISAAWSGRARRIMKWDPSLGNPKQAANVSGDIFDRFPCIKSA